MMWLYVQEMGGWSEKDFLISVDLDDGSYCNAAYGGPSNTRVAEDTGCDSKECRFHFFATEDIAVGEEIVCNYSSFSDGSGWARFSIVLFIGPPVADHVDSSGEAKTLRK